MEINVEKLLEAGMHFGHRVSRRNPKMEPYIFGKRNLINIIDLRETARGLIRACNLLEKLASGGAQFLFIGTKRQAKNVVRSEAQRVDMHYVTERWLGGSLTNFDTVRSRLKRLEELESMETDGSLELQSKKMISSLAREKRKIRRNLDGMRKLEKRPDAIIVIDPRREHNAVDEASKLQIPVVALLDTDCDPDQVDIPIPGNDDAMRSIELVMRALVDSIIEGRKAWKAGSGINLRDLYGIAETADEAAIPSKEELKRRRGGGGGRGDGKPGGGGGGGRGGRGNKLTRTRRKDEGEPGAASEAVTVAAGSEGAGGAE